MGALAIKTTHPFRFVWNALRSLASVVLPASVMKPWWVEDGVLYVDNQKITKIVFLEDVQIHSNGSVFLSSDKHVVMKSGWDGRTQDYYSIHLNPDWSEFGLGRYPVELSQMDGYADKVYGKYNMRSTTLSCDDPNGGSDGQYLPSPK